MEAQRQLREGPQAGGGYYAPAYQPIFEPEPLPQSPQVRTWSPEPAHAMPPYYPAQFNGVPLDGSPQGRPGCPGVPLPGSNYCVVQLSPA